MTHATKACAALFWASCLFIQSAETVSLFSTNASWRFFKGRTEASSPPDAWRSQSFNDSGFTLAPAPFSYGEGYTTGTIIDDMQNQYTCIFLRRTFDLTNVAEIASLRLGARVDDGFVAWINGVEVQRVNMPGGDVTITTVANNATEPVPFAFYHLNSASNYLVQGANVIAVQVFNTSLSSSDLVFDASLDTILTETNPPTVLAVTPTPGTVTSLTQITVQFSEPVSGVNADDLVINTVSATGVSGGGDTYTFTFAQPEYGTVYISWATNHGIADLAGPPNTFDRNGAGATWQYDFLDMVPPTVTQIRPTPSTTVRELAEVRVKFSEPVAGVNAADLTINGVPATNVLVLPGPEFVFQFAPAAAGVANVAWAGNHGITDLALTPNPFGGGSWSYTIDPNASLADVVINEILAANESGIGDAAANNGDPEPLPWIELHNRSANTIDLTGWSLSDDPSFPTRWVFPQRVIGPGEYLIVFASGLNVTNATGTNRLHTNFKLSRGGEFLGLYSPDAPPQFISGFAEYPEQRNNHSYGPDANGHLRYFATPTPGTPNGTSTIVGVVEPVHFSANRGLFMQPFDLVLTSPTRGSFIRYTTNGSEPTLSNGFDYTQPLRIAATTILRAAAFRENFLPSRVGTHSYFLNLSAAQRSLPVISIVTDQGNLTGPTGIIGISNVVQQGDGRYVPGPGGYHNPSLHGIAWERPTSAEYFTLPENDGFQIDCGIRVQGSDWQRPRTTVSSKFSFRLYFRGAYGPGRLRHPLFPLASSEEFDQVVLRAGFNDNSNPFIRDELTRRLSHDMGNVASHGTLVNLFVNGVYKGYYNPTERVHEEFMQSYLGGSDDWDVVGPSFATGAGQPGVIDGDRTHFVSTVSFITTANVNNPAAFEEIRGRLELTNYVDYLLLNMYAAMADWPQNNWRAGRDRAGGPWRFVIWDAEWAMGIYGRGVSSNVFVMNGPGPERGGLASTDSEIARMYQALYASPEFRLLWADRVHKHMFNGGALTDANITNRFGQLRAQLSGVLPSMDLGILNTWVPQRRNILISQMIQQGLFASSNAPVFSQFGGRVAPGFALSMSLMSGAGTIYYTTNGVDPRVAFSGAIASSASAYTGPVAISGNMLVKARTLNGGQWSALTEAPFEVAVLGTPVRITELHYNPLENPAYEFLELMNIGGTPANLGGASFQGINLSFPLGTTLAPGEKIVLATDLNPAAFAARYPGVTVFGFYSGSLANGGERIALLDVQGNIITSLDYDDENGWALAADGRGSSLEIIDVYGNPDDPANWRASASVGGTPGAMPPAPPTPAVQLNEVLADNAGSVNHGGTFPDFVELANTSGSAVDLSGWSLTDDGNARKFVFPAGTTMAANAHLVVWCDAATNTTPGLHSGFALSRNGESIFLYDSTTNLVDAITLGLQLTDRSVGRVGGEWTLNVPTPNAANSAAALGSASALRINEFLANALPGDPDWIELFNNSTSPVALRGIFLATTTAVHQVTSLSFISPFGFAQFFADEAVGPDRLDFKLPAAGGAIVMHDITGAEIDRVTYSAQSEGVSRGRLPNGSANIVNFPGTASPNATNYAATYNGPVLSEVLARNVSAVTNAGRAADFIELFNSSGAAFSLAGMSLSVNSAEAGEWRFPPNASIPAGGYLVVWCDGGLPASTNLGSLNTGESLDGESGGVYLFNAAGQLVNSVEYGFQAANLSIGLVGSTWRLLAAPTPGAANGTAAALGSPTALRINEWMAQPGDGPDWFELFNTTNAPVEMSNLVLTDDPTVSGTNEFRVPPLSFIGGGDFVQWIADSNPDEGRNHVNFDLSSQGETLRLYASNGSNILDSVTFGLQGLSISQGRLPDGAANVVLFPGAETPGESNYQLVPGVVINELLTHANAPLEAAIELANHGVEPVDISGWFLSNDALVPNKFRIPDGTVLAPGAHVVFNASQFGAAFALDRARGGELWLSAADASGNLTGLRTRARFGAAAEGVSLGRYENGTTVDYVAQSATTLGAANAAPLVGPIVIHEIMYHPPSGIVGATEFIELRNISSGTVNLFDPARPENRWRLNNAVEFTFPAGASLPAGGYALVVPFDPAANPAALTAFREIYGVSHSVPVFGPFDGQLNNDGETIELLRPDLPDGAFVPYLVVDKVSYRDNAPWPTGAVEGGGSSLQRRDTQAYGNNVGNWIAAAPTAGYVNGASPVAPPTLTSAPSHTNVLVNTDLLLSASATGDGPLAWQWRFNGSEIAGATNASLGIELLRLQDSGIYDVIVQNSGGSAVSGPARISVVEPATILSAPPGVVSTNGGSNFVFSVSTGGTAPLHHQWSFDGSPIPGANSPVLALSNLTMEQCGHYTLTVSNAYGVAGTNITLLVLIRPTFTVHPQPQTILQGGTAVFTVVAGPDHPLVPLTYRWTRSGLSILTSSVPRLVLTDNTRSWVIRCSVVNLASGPGGVASSTAALTVLPDNDRDGMADAWEVRFGFNTNDVADSLLDLDGDGMISRHEYVANTDPTDPASLLKLSLAPTNAAVLRFVAQSNVAYTVEFGTNLTSAVWSNYTSIPAQPLVRTVEVHSATPPPREQFYRVVIPAPPTE